MAGKKRRGGDPRDRLDEEDEFSDDEDWYSSDDQEGGEPSMADPPPVPTKTKSKGKRKLKAAKKSQESRESEVSQKAAEVSNAPASSPTISLVSGHSTLPPVDWGDDSGGRAAAKCLEQSAVRLAGTIDFRVSAQWSSSVIKKISKIQGESMRKAGYGQSSIKTWNVKSGEPGSSGIIQVGHLLKVRCSTFAAATLGFTLVPSMA